MKPYARRFIRICIGLLIIPFIFVAVDRVIVLSNLSRIYIEPKEIPQADAILVLGASVRGEEVSTILQERLEAALEVYHEARAPKILLSGDYSSRYYDEAAAMALFLERHGVPGSNLILDHAGFSTYDSLYRAQSVFGLNSVIIVSQEFHLPRSLFIAWGLGLKANGFNASRRQLSMHATIHNTWREPLARFKALYDVVTGTLPSFTGSGLPIDASGKSIRE